MKGLNKEEKEDILAEEGTCGKNLKASRSQCPGRLKANFMVAAWRAMGEDEAGGTGTEQDPRWSSSMRSEVRISSFKSKGSHR